MSEATINAAIKTILEGISGVGVIHDRERFSRSAAKWLELMRDGTGKVNAWTIHRVEVPSERGTVPTITRYHHFILMHHRQLDDENASERTFQAHLDDVFAAFKSNYKLNNTCLNSDPFEVLDTDTARFQKGEITLHVATCLLVAHERVNYGE